MEVHRCQFVEYMPEAVHCMAFNGDCNLLAVSRATGDIEIWNLEHDWLLERRIPGGSAQSVEAMTWVGDRLFTAGLHGFITEWDLRTLQPKVIADSFGGPVWCLAANRDGDVLAAGCEDGCVRLFDIMDGGLSFMRAFDKQEARILSLAWHKGGAVLVAGTADSKIMKFNVKTGRSALRITVEDIHKESTLVWAVAVLSDMTIVSGDSLGNTNIWDGVHGTLKQSFKLHEGDVLALVVNRAGDMVYASGIDHKVVQLRLVAESENKRKWVPTDKLRVHTHDVRALAIAHAKGRDVLVSAGVDTQLIVYSAERFGSMPVRRIPPFPHRSFLSLAPDARTLMVQFSEKIQLWRVGSSGSSQTNGHVSQLEDGTLLNVTEQPRLLAELKPKLKSHIACAAISRSASFVAASDSNSTKLFRVTVPTPGSESTPTTVQKVPGHALAGVYSLALCFTPDGKYLVSAGADGVLRVMDLAALEVVQEYSEHAESGPITHVAVSTDSHWLASADVTNTIHVFSLKKAKLHSTLPKFDTQHCALAFQPSTNHVVVACVCNRVHVYDVAKRALSDWTRKNINKFPVSYLKKKQKTIAMVFDPAADSSALVYDHYMISRLDLNRPIEDGAHVHAFKRSLFTNSTATSNKRRVKSGPQAAHVNGDAMDIDGAERDAKTDRSKQLYTINRYQPVLFVDFMGPRSMVVVERPWLTVMSSFPAPLQRRRYGT